MTDIDKKNIYTGLVNLLTMNCDTCMDKNQLDKILLCAFKLDLIEYAENNNYDSVDELWNSIAKTLGITLDGEPRSIESTKCSCVNGSCAIC